MLTASSQTPWVGELFECEAQISQSRQESKQLDTTRGTISKRLHNDMTKAYLGCAFTTEDEIALELSCAKTVKKSYNFNAAKFRYTYQPLHDLQYDPISLSVSAIFSLSPRARVRDLSSQNDAPLEGALQVALGKEFGFTKSGFLRTWIRGAAQANFPGSPSLLADGRLEYILHKNHTFGLSYDMQKGMSSKKLQSAESFSSWSKIGYMFQEIGAHYSYKKTGYGTLLAQVSKRFYAKYAAKDSHHISLSLIIPFSFF